MRKFIGPAADVACSGGMDNGIETSQSPFVSKGHRAEVLAVQCTVGKIGLVAECLHQLLSHLVVMRHQCLGPRVAVINPMSHDLEDMSNDTLAAANAAC